MYRSLMTCLCASQSRGAGATAGGSCSGGPSDVDEAEVGVVPSGEGVDIIGLSTQATWWTGCMGGRAAEEVMTLTYPGLRSMAAAGCHAAMKGGCCSLLSRQSGRCSSPRAQALEDLPGVAGHINAVGVLLLLKVAGAIDD